MKKIAIFPGSFDPFTVGHYSIVQRALNFVDEVVIAIGVNDAKKSLFSIEKRKMIIQKSFINNPNIKVESYDSLTVDFAKEIGATIILRGIRSIADFEYEKTIADINAKTSIIQKEDRTLELRLKQLDTEQNALKTEMDAVKKVIKDNVEKTFKTFSD